MPNETQKYMNGDLTVVWKPKLCKHSAKCALGLPEVFKPKARPWIQMENSDSDQIEAQVSQCPSGALTCYRKR